MGKDWRVVGAVSLLSALALGVQGYHPYAEDGGLYVAGIEKLLDPALFAVRPEFVTAPLRFSLFAPSVAAVVRGTHLPLEWVLLILYAGSIWLTLFAAWMLVSRCVKSFAGRLGGVALLACWLTIPIAGTSLMLMDPYVTARSLSTPLVLLALAWAMDRNWLGCGVALGVAACFHPLMTGYGVASLCVLKLEKMRHTSGDKARILASSKIFRLKPGPISEARPKTSARSIDGVVEVWGVWLLGGFALVGAGVVQTWAPAESAEYVRVAMTRYYWFPFRWEWFEQVGLIAPLIVLWWVGRHNELGRTAVGLGCIALAVAVMFARPDLATHLVARMQPLRCFQMVYVVMILLLGAWVGERWLGRHPSRWGALLAAMGGLMFFVQMQTFPASDHFEAPWIAPVNRWEQAFVWVRQHTPKDALFALDARYITRGRQEDAQCFRAIAKRSMLADYSKDGGEAAITPSLTSAWVEGQSAQANLEIETDAERLAKLRPLGVGWVVLEMSSTTAWPCPYANDVVKVCRMP